MARGIVERTTEDLDLFATSASRVDALLPALEAALRGAGLTVERTRVALGYARLEVSEGDERTVVDIGYDARIRAIEATPLGALLSEEELAADKLLAPERPREPTHRVAHDLAQVDEDGERWLPVETTEGRAWCPAASSAAQPTPIMTIEAHPKIQAQRDILGEPVCGGTPA